MTRQTLIACGAFVALAGFLFWYVAGRKPVRSPDEYVRLAGIALAKGDYSGAAGLASQVPDDDVAFAAAMTIAGEAFTRLNQLTDAANAYRKVPFEDVEHGLLAKFSLGSVLLHAGNLTEAELAFSAVLDVEPKNIAVHSQLAFLLGAAGRRWESQQHFIAVMKSGEASVQELGLLGDIERPLEEGDFLAKCLESHPDDVMVRLGIAADQFDKGETQLALAALQEIVKERSDLLAAQSLLGEILLNESDSLFARWHAQLPKGADDWPDIWFVRGLKARQIRAPKMAARAFWMALRRFPTHRRATYQLGRVLSELNEPSASEFAEQSKSLHELSRWLMHAMQSDGQNEEVLRNIVGLLERMGRIWEASAWAHIASQRFPGSQWTSAVLTRLLPMLQPELPLVLRDRLPGAEFDFSAFPSFEVPFGTAQDDGKRGATSEVSTIHFQEEASVGLDMVYINGEMDQHPGARMQEQSGGGVAVLDLDLDLWPDLYFVQGGVWDQTSDQPSTDYSQDRIYRNIRGQGFSDVTEPGRIAETGFGQSCAVGDVNEDGFPDCYVANIGPNRLYLNNGDGTFSSAESTEGFRRSDWTSSAAIADLNADGYADIFDANYVSGEDVYTRLCSGRGCSPTAFTGTPDRLHIGHGDGRFRDIATATPLEDSKGLGVLVANFGVSDGLAVFVANDQVANFLLVPSNEASAQVSLTDVGFKSGLAYNEDGLLFATMGIAAEDVDHNGLLDLFVTNFQGESNTLYLQTVRGMFHDTTKLAGLQTPSIPFVGWGTQFLDADLDGESDLVITNGHVEDYRDQGRGYQMRSQFFRNRGNARFEELMAADVGDFFDKQLHGRGLSRLDWDRDGKMDFVIASTGTPPSLVTNVTTDCGRFLNLRVVATKSSRDAIGTFATAIAGKMERKKQVVAGDGYHAGNERLLQFGLGDNKAVETVTISWPSGAKSTMFNVPTETTLTVVEGMPIACGWHMDEPLSLPVETMPQE